MLQIAAHFLIEGNTNTEARGPDNDPGRKGSARICVWHKNVGKLCGSISFVTRFADFVLLRGKRCDVIVVIKRRRNSGRYAARRKSVLQTAFRTWRRRRGRHACAIAVEKLRHFSITGPRTCRTGAARRRLCQRY